MKKMEYTAPQAVSDEILDQEYSILAASNESFDEKSGIYDPWPDEVS